MGRLRLIIAKGAVQGSTVCQRYSCYLEPDCAVLSPSVVLDFLQTPWTVGHQAPLSRQEYLSGLPGPPPGDLPNRGIKPRSPALQVDSLPSEPAGKPK